MCAVLISPTSAVATTFPVHALRSHSWRHTQPTHAHAPHSNALTSSCTALAQLAAHAPHAHTHSPVRAPRVRPVLAQHRERHLVPHVQRRAVRAHGVRAVVAQPLHVGRLAVHSRARALRVSRCVPPRSVQHLLLLRGVVSLGGRAAELARAVRPMVAARSQRARRSGGGSG